MKQLIFIASLVSVHMALLWGHTANATIKIAVIDTGLSKDHVLDVKLCKTGHADFTTDRAFTTVADGPQRVPMDSIGHGTNIAGLIDRYARESRQDYCLIILKYFTPDVIHPLAKEIAAINYARMLKVDFINLSGGGVDYNKREISAVKSFLDEGGIFVAAAGNEHSDLGESGNVYYPAMSDPRVISVGNLDHSGVRMPSSNFGSPVTSWEIGENQTALGITMTGTSQAAAIKTGKLVSLVLISRDKIRQIAKIRK